MVWVKCLSGDGLKDIVDVGVLFDSFIVIVGFFCNILEFGDSILVIEVEIGSILFFVVVYDFDG